MKPRQEKQRTVATAAGGPPRCVQALLVLLLASGAAAADARTPCEGGSAAPRQRSGDHGCEASRELHHAVGERQIKSAFLYNFTKFVDWPAESLAGPDVPIVIGVLGGDPLAAELRLLVRDRKAKGRAIVVEAVHTPDEARRAQLLFVSSSEHARFVSLRPALHGTAVLTVGETASFIEAGGIIAFVQQGDKLRFAINMTAAEHGGLKISAQLQKLAVSVKRAP